MSKPTAFLNNMAESDGRMGRNIFTEKSFCLITGASRGLGRSIALNFADEFPDGSAFCLIARNGEQLKEVKQAIANRRPHVFVYTLTADLANVNSQQCVRILKDALQGTNVSDFTQAVIVHNAASLGNISKPVSQYDDAVELQKYFALNVTSPVVLNSEFLKVFYCVDNVVINISSICALQPFSSWGYYCTGKAARDMMFHTLATEEDDRVRVLNYAPGPLNTEMQLRARTETGDQTLRNLFSEMNNTGKLLSCDTSVKKLISLLKSNTFESGAHIDYYDKE